MVHVNNYSKPMEFLEVAYRDLDFQEGSGFFRLPLTNITPDLAQAGWIEQAIRLRADSIFFVNGYPTVLFFNLDISPSSDNSSIEDNIRNLHLRVWNTCLVPLFFVALPGELRVYSAYQTPARNLTAWGDSSRYLNRIQTITKILELREFSRPEIETGNLFGKRPSEFDRRQRVDQWLLKNLRLLREKLGGEDETKREYIHALIGRSIFIRYLEDREILVNGYYSDDEISQNNKYRQYTDVLQSKDDTYNLFQKLRNDFNGDMFPLDSKEIETITQSDLNLLRDFLLGRSVGDSSLICFSGRISSI